MIDSEQIDIKKYWGLIKKRRYLFLMVSLLVMSIIVWGSFLFPVMYTAKSSVFLEHNVIKQLVKGIVAPPSIDQRLKILKLSMNSRPILLKVIKALDLDIAKTPTEVSSLISEFRNNTSISLKKKDYFTVSYTGKDPKLVRDYVNTLIHIYVEENVSAKREEASEANRFLKEQINYYKRKMADAEDKLNKYRNEKNMIYSLNEKEIVTSLRGFRTELDDISLKIKALQAKEKTIQKQLSGEEPLTLIMIDNTKGMGKQPLSQRLRVLKQRLQFLMTKYTEKYPEVISIEAEIEMINDQIENQGEDSHGFDVAGDSMYSGGMSGVNPVYQQLKEDLLNAKSEIDSLKAKSVFINNRMQKLETELKNIPNEKMELANFARDRDAFRRTYEQLLSKMGQTEISKQMKLEDKGTKFQIIDRAVFPITPVSPDRVMIILIGLAAGLASGIGILMLLEYYDDSIKDIDTLKTNFNLSILAVIPEIITKEEIYKKKKMDKIVYAFSIAYLSIIGGLFIKEILNKL